MEAMPAEFVESWNARQLRLRIGAVGHAREARMQAIFSVRADDPTPRFVIPIERGHLRLEDGTLVEVVVTADRLGVCEDLRSVSALLGGDGSELFE
jgi:hypothetical protein